MQKTNQTRRFLSAERVAGMLKDVDTKFLTVDFQKVNGDFRTVNGLLKPTSKMVGSERGLAQGEAMRARGQVPIWTGNRKGEGWKSFYGNRVYAIRSKGLRVETIGAT